MKIFITGGTGFIGKYLTKKLAQKGYDLLLLSRNSNEFSSLELEKRKENRIENIRWLKGDLSNIEEWKERIKEFAPEVAIHLGWEGIPNYGFEVSVKNLQYGLNLFLMLEEIGCKKIISTGSCWEYGKQKGCLNEESIINPHNAFTSAKNSLLWIGKSLAEEKKIQFIWTRLFYVYGPGQRKNSLIPYIIDCIKEGKKPEIKTPGAKNDFVYVEDVAEALVAILESKESYQVYNIGSGNLTSVREIINLVYAHLKINIEVDNSAAIDNILYDGFWADLSKIKKETGWEPKVDIKEGILKMITSRE